MKKGRSPDKGPARCGGVSRGGDPGPHHHGFRWAKPKTSRSGRLPLSKKYRKSGGPFPFAEVPAALVHLTITTRTRRQTSRRRLPVAVRARFTRIPKVHDLVMAGVPTEAIATYAALADHPGNKSGLCWPKMETLARRLSRSPRTVQRHLHLLKERGLVEFVERRRDNRGRFGAYLYRLLHLAAAATARGGGAKRGRAAATTTGHGG